jgi:serine/threonine protein phosphatase PrpC
MTSSEVAQVQNVLYRALGQNSAVEVDTYIQNLPPASSLLLCSDGLWGVVEKSVLVEIIAGANTPQEACQQLTAEANKNGGPDNITSIIVTIGVEE